MLRRSIAIVVVLSSIVLLAACGGASTPTPASDSASQSQAASPTAAPVVAPTTAPVPTQAPAPTDVPAPTNPPAPSAGGVTGGGADCLVGTWQFEDMSAYFSSVLAKTNGEAQYVGQDGTIIYTFGADGKAKIDAQSFKAKMKMTIGNVSIPMDVDMTGSATANYLPSDPNKVTFSNSDSGDFKFSVIINGQESSVITGDQLAGLGMSSDPRYNTFTYECSADTLRYTPPITNAQLVVLKRVSP